MKNICLFHNVSLYIIKLKYKNTNLTLQTISINSNKHGKISSSLITEVL